MKCSETADCNHFMFLEFTSGAKECFLLRSCDVNSTSVCSEDPECQLAISGPVAPPLTESCCEEFQAVQCEARYEVGHEFDISVEWVCQRLCRDQLSCSYWTLLGGDCFLYSACGTPEVKTSWEKGLHIFYSSLGVKSKLCLVRFPNPPSWELGNLTVL